MQSMMNAWCRSVATATKRPWLLVCLVVPYALFGLAQASETNIKTSQPWLQQTVSAADARHLLSRTGFSAEPEAQLTIAGLSRLEAIDKIMAGFKILPSRQMPTWTQEPAPLYWARRDLDAEQRRQFNRLRDQELSELRQWWIDEMLITPSPQTERMVLFWHDHFATSYSGLNRQSMAMARQNQTFRQLGMGNFETLLRAMIRDPALLTFLDNVSNRKRSPNENLARELMELFTLGEGNYAESDVREAARALTGYGVSQNKNLSARFNYWQHDGGQKTILGQTGRFNGDDLIDVLLQQPALDEHIATRFWHWLVSDEAPSGEQLMPLASHFRQTGHDLSALYRKTLESSAFWEQRYRASLIKSPTTLVIGAARELDVAKATHHQLPQLLRLAGQDLLAPPNVAGWKEGAAWITPGRLLNRYAALEALVNSVPERRDDVSPEQMAKANAMKPMMNGESGAVMADSMNQNMTMGMSRSVGGTMGNSMGNSMGKAMNESMDVPAMALDGNPKTTMAVRMASEEFRGPVQYQFELLDADNTSLWLGAVSTLKNGWDTVINGPMESRDQLPWQWVELPNDVVALPTARFVRVHFVNDDAGDAGDRNLYVATLSAGGVQSLPVMGSQQSDCAPDNGAEAGDLYCNGFVDITIPSAGERTQLGQAIAISEKQVHYASKHVEWSAHNRNNGAMNVRLVFQDVHYNGKHWPVFSAWYRETPQDKLALWMQNYDCWPDCIEQWPACAWTDEQDPSSVTVHIPVEGAYNENAACHIDALSDSEALMLDSLLMHAPKLLQETLADENRRFPSSRVGVKRGLRAMIDRFSDPSVQKRFEYTTATERTAPEVIPTWVEHVTPRPSNASTASLPVIPQLAMHLEQRNEQIEQAGFSWPAVFAPGLPLAVLPGWEQDTRSSSTRDSLRTSVKQWLLNPAYQVY